MIISGKLALQLFFSTLVTKNLVFQVGGNPDTRFSLRLTLSYFPDSCPLVIGLSLGQISKLKRNSKSGASQHSATNMWAKELWPKFGLVPRWRKWSISLYFTNYQWVIRWNQVLLNETLTHSLVVVDMVSLSE